MSEFSGIACKPNDEPANDDIANDLGPCCCCGKAQDGTVRNLLMLDFEAPEGTVGWGCVVCHAPMRGANAIVCDDCIDRHGRDLTQHLRFIQGGHYPADKVRVPLEGFERIDFGHDLDFHPEIGGEESQLILPDDPEFGL